MEIAAARGGFRDGGDVAPQFDLCWQRGDGWLNCTTLETDYKVSLDIFEGPLDLLLYLIKKDEVAVQDVSIERVTKQYLDYLQTFSMLNIDLAGEFIVMAANLMYIKSRTLLPKHFQPPEEEVEEEDPRWELIRQLLEYKKFKDASAFLQKRELEQEQVYELVPDTPEKPKEVGELPLPDIGIFDLISAFRKVLGRFEVETIGEIADDRFTVSDKIDFLINEVKPGEQMTFFALFEEATSKNEVIVTFLALLELIRLKEFRFEQRELMGGVGRWESTRPTRPTRPVLPGAWSTASAGPGRWGDWAKWELGAEWILLYFFPPC
jgi:segregation and condensation protein A